MYQSIQIAVSLLLSVVWLCAHLCYTDTQALRAKQPLSPEICQCRTFPGVYVDVYERRRQLYLCLEQNQETIEKRDFICLSLGFLLQHVLSFLAAVFLLLLIVEAKKG